LYNGDYIEYKLALGENLTAEIPITVDITENIGKYEAFVEISSENYVIGKTNPIEFEVHDYPEKSDEIYTRDFLYREIDRLDAEVLEKSTALNNVRNALIAKDVYISEDTDESNYGEFILGLYTYDICAGLIEGTLQNLIIPQGTTKIHSQIFYDTNLVSVIIPPSVRTIELGSFQSCRSLESLTLNDGLVTIGQSAFAGCSALTEVTIPGTVEALEYYAFRDCDNLKKVIINHGVERIDTYAFNKSNSGPKITELSLPNTLNYLYWSFYRALSPNATVTIENGFDCNGLDLSEVSNASVEQIMSWLYALNDRTYRTTAYTLTIGTTNINKLTAEQIAIATDKNWNLA
jgi:hypothetical protein